jgi:hypothetical protein
MTTSACTHRRGITLMEVLISIGILAVGLSSVVALVPAGKSEAAKAVMLDRGANLAMNALNDAVTFGLTRPNSVGRLASAGVVIFDPLSYASGSCVWSTTSARVTASGTMKPKGIFASETDASMGTGTSAVALSSPILQGRDDLMYTTGEQEDDPPLNAFTSGIRSFQGRTSCLLSIAPLDGVFAPGSIAKLTAVVFHNRNLADAADAVVSGSYSPAGTILVNASALPEGRTLKEVVRPGTAVFCLTSGAIPTWYQISMASPDESAGLVYVTFVGDVEPLPGPLQIALDSIGLAEKMVKLEGSGPYGR